MPKCNLDKVKMIKFATQVMLLKGNIQSSDHKWVSEG